MSSPSGFHVLKLPLNLKRVNLSSLRITLFVAFHRPGQSSSETLCIFTTFTPKILVPTSSPVYATFKCSTKCIFKKSPLLTSSEIAFISTARLRCQMGQSRAWRHFHSKAKRCNLSLSRTSQASQGLELYLVLLQRHLPSWRKPPIGLPPLLAHHQRPASRSGDCHRARPVCLYLFKDKGFDRQRLNWN